MNIYTPEQQDFLNKHYKNAVETICSNGQTGVAILQRKLKIGFNDAYFLLEVLASEKVILAKKGSLQNMDGSKVNFNLKKMNEYIKTESITIKPSVKQ